MRRIAKVHQPERRKNRGNRGLMSKADRIPGSATGFEARGFQRVAVLLPCFNEETAIAKVVADFRAVLPEGVVHVYDNNSTDRTIEVARAAGATVGRETHQGKGNVVRRMFADIDAEVYVLADGDATYDAGSAPALIARLLEGRLDMVVGARVHQEDAAYPMGHRFGNRLFSAFFDWVFDASFEDILSGYRVFSRRFVKSFPVLSRGFEIEIELAVHALELELPVAEMPTPYYKRAAGSTSKLSTWRDGFRILSTIINLSRTERPLAFFGGLGIAFAAMSIMLAVPIFATYLEAGVVPRFPTAILSTGLMLLAFLFAIAGLILDTVTKGRREMKLLAYLAHRAPGEDSDRRQA
jgi:glycosyltransferase involved in cell wall biosynthesis